MNLIIEGIRKEPVTGESLLQIVRRLGLDCEETAKRPLAAKIAGEVFNLNYVPVREKDNGVDRSSIRAAMAASGGIVHLLSLEDPSGREVYTRTAQFVVFLAVSQLWPHANATMNCTLGPALYIQVENAPEFCITKLKEQIQKIVKEDIPLVRRRISKEQAEYLRLLQKYLEAFRRSLPALKQEDAP